MNNLFKTQKTNLVLKSVSKSRKSSVLYSGLGVISSIYTFSQILTIKPSYASHLVDLPISPPSDATIHLDLNAPPPQSPGYRTEYAFNIDFTDTLLNNNIWLWDHELFNTLEVDIKIAVLFDPLRLGTPSNPVYLFFLNNLGPKQTFYVDIAVQDNPPETTIQPDLNYSYSNFTPFPIGFDTAIWESPTVNPNFGIPGEIGKAEIRDEDGGLVEYVDPISVDDCMKDPDCNNALKNPIKVTLKKEVPEPTSTLSFLALGTLGLGSTLKRKLKSSKSPEKQLEKVS